MKNAVVLSTMALAALTAGAQPSSEGRANEREVARVLSSTPIVRQVALPQEECTLSNAYRADATASTPTRDAQNCVSEVRYEDRTLGYEVTYEYAGRRYTTQTAQDPGATIPVQISAASGGLAAAAPSDVAAQRPYPQAAIPQPGVVVPSGTPAPAVYVAPAPAYYPPAYYPPAYYAPSYYAPAYVGPAFAAPIGLSLNLGYSRGFHGHHRGWR